MAVDPHGSRNRREDDATITGRPHVTNGPTLPGVACLETRSVKDRFMVAVTSTMLPLGTPLPEFALLDAVSGERVASVDFPEGRPVLVMFLCNHCPYVVHVRRQITRLAQDYGPCGVDLVAINSNDVNAYPDDAPRHMARLAREEGWTFPFLYDETQSVAKAFQAACTPEFYVFDARHRLAYRGQLDASRPRNTEPVTGRDVRNALDAVLSGTPVEGEQKPSIGCNIKWRAGNEPPYIF